MKNIKLHALGANIQLLLSEQKLSTFNPKVGSRNGGISRPFNEVESAGDATGCPKRATLAQRSAHSSARTYLSYLHLIRSKLRQLKSNLRKMKFKLRQMNLFLRQMKFVLRLLKSILRILKANLRKMIYILRKLKYNLKRNLSVQLFQSRKW